MNGNEESFTMESPPFRANLYTVGKVLKQVEDVLERFYGDDYRNWHEMCLDAKKFIVDKIVSDQNNNPSSFDIQEWARLALGHVFSQYEV